MYAREKTKYMGFTQTEKGSDPYLNECENNKVFFFCVTITICHKLQMNWYLPQVANDSATSVRVYE